MKRTILSLLVAALFAGIGTSAIAQNVTADQPAAGTQAIAPTDAGTVPDKTAKNDVPAAGSAKTNAAGSKADYTAAQDKAQSQYKDAKAKCESMKGDAVRACVADAGTARTASLAQAKTQSEGQGTTNASKPAADGMGNSDPSPATNPTADGMGNSDPSPKHTK